MENAEGELDLGANLQRQVIMYLIDHPAALPQLGLTELPINFFSPCGKLKKAFWKVKRVHTKLRPGGLAGTEAGAPKGVACKKNGGSCWSRLGFTLTVATKLERVAAVVELVV